MILTWNYTFAGEGGGAKRLVYSIKVCLEPERKIDRHVSSANFHRSTRFNHAIIMRFKIFVTSYVCVYRKWPTCEGRRGC